jgi:hypothetical protein
VRLAAAALMLLLAGCENKEPVRIDGSSKERFEESSWQARRDLPVADRIVFDRAIRTVGGRRHAVRDTEALARTTFDGMTAAEIVADQRARD